MRRDLIILVFLSGIVFLLLSFNRGFCPLIAPRQEKIVGDAKMDPVTQVNEGLLLEAHGKLRFRKDKTALSIFNSVLRRDPANLNALSGKAEVLRRERKFKEAQDLLNEVLKKDPQHPAALLSLAYIRYKDDNLDEAVRLVKKALKSTAIDNDTEALCYMMLGTINSVRCAKGWLLDKFVYGTQIKGSFLKARELSPELPEVHLGLGTFYLLAPAIAGGNIEEALKELKYAVGLTPEFATPNARLAQAYKKKGDLEKYDLYLKRAKELDPENEVVRELMTNDKIQMTK